MAEKTFERNMGNHKKIFEKTNYLSVTHQHNAENDKQTLTPNGKQRKLN
jgi:hypothetical protein